MEGRVLATSPLPNASRIFPQIVRGNLFTLQSHRRIRVSDYQYSSIHLGRNKRVGPSLGVKAIYGDNPIGSGGPSIVDADLIVLRKRMEEVKKEETNYIPPQHWMEWEKKWCASSYDSDVCTAVSSLQNALINTRPYIVIAVLCLISLSVPASLFLLFKTCSTHLDPFALVDFLAKLNA
eukprot:Gb_20333 [translate_table: standard]